MAKSVRVYCSVRGGCEDEEVKSWLLALLCSVGGERGRIDDGSWVRRRTSSIGSDGVSEECGGKEEVG